MWFPTQCWEKQGRHELPWMLFAPYPYSPVHTCIPWVSPSCFSCWARGGEESPGGTARHYRLPKQQQALLKATCNNPATTAFFLSRNWFVPCGLVAFLFGFWGGGSGGKMYLIRPSPPSTVNPRGGERLARTWHQGTPFLTHKSQPFSSSHISGLEQDQTAGPLPLGKRKSTVEQIFIQI